MIKDFFLWRKLYNKRSESLVKDDLSFAQVLRAFEVEIKRLHLENMRLARIVQMMRTEMLKEKENES